MYCLIFCIGDIAFDATAISEADAIINSTVIVDITRYFVGITRYIVAIFEADATINNTVIVDITGYAAGHQRYDAGIVDANAIINRASTVIVDITDYCALIIEADAIINSTVIVDITGYAAGIIEANAIINSTAIVDTTRYSAVVSEINAISNRATIGNVAGEYDVILIIKCADGATIKVDAINGALIGNVTFYRRISHCYRGYLPCTMVIDTG